MSFLSRRMHSRRTLTAKRLMDAILNALLESATSNYEKIVQTFNQNSLWNWKKCTERESDGSY